MNENPHQLHFTNVKMFCKTVFQVPVVLVSLPHYTTVIVLVRMKFGFLAEPVEFSAKFSTISPTPTMYFGV